MGHFARWANHCGAKEAILQKWLKHVEVWRVEAQKGDPVDAISALNWHSFCLIDSSHSKAQERNSSITKSD